jgi:hypothetical protein
MHSKYRSNTAGVIVIGDAHPFPCSDFAEGFTGEIEAAGQRNNLCYPTTSNFVRMHSSSELLFMALHRLSSWRRHLHDRQQQDAKHESGGYPLDFISSIFTVRMEFLAGTAFSRPTNEAIGSTPEEYG